MDRLVLRHDGGHDDSSSIVKVHHETSHYANIKYGYILLFVSIIAMIWISVTNSLKFNVSLRNRTFNLLSKPSPRYVLLPVWLFILVLLAFIGNNPLTLNGFAKRLGRITFSTFPLILFLSLKPSPLPNTYYVKLLSLHKWVARISVLVGSLHGILYTVYFIKKGTTKKMLKVDNLLGVVLLFGLLLVLITSLRPLRVRYYKLFYLLHYPLAYVFLILACFHARPGVSFLALWSVFILAGQVFYRIFTSRTVKVIDSYQISPSLYSITLPRDSMPDYFPIGSHLRISHRSLLSWLQPTHPYTIASLSTDEENIRLLIRNTNFIVSKNAFYTISGPYASTINQEVINNNSIEGGQGGAEYTPVNKNIDGVKKVIIFAGGSGLSFASPLVRELDTIGIPYKFVWITKDKSDIKALDLLNIDNVDIFVTGNNSNAYSDILSNPSRSKPISASTDDDESIEFDELLDNDDDEDEEASTPPSSDNETKPASKSLSITYSRPDFTECIQDFILPGQEHTSWAVACGPSRLVQDVQSWAAKKNIQFSGEKYFL